MAVDYDRAFAKVIQRPWNDTPDEQRREAEFPRRQGKLAPDAPGSFALRDSYSYQRGHADVFREVYKKAPHTPPRKGERLLVVDIGAGAATVAVALAEALGRCQRQRVDYLAFEPNPSMQKLGSRILRHLNAEFNSAEYIESLDDVDFTGTDKLLFSFSYVVHQSAVGLAHREGWARVIKRAVIAVDKAVELIYTTSASLKNGAHIHLKQMLKEAKILRKQRPIDVQVRRRFPDPDSGDGQIRWEEQSRVWEVNAEHWILNSERMSLQMSLIDTETAAAPMGLEYYPDFLTASEQDGLLDRIDSSEWLADLSRRVMHFGYKYDYTSRSLDESARIGPLPEWLAQLAHMVREAASEEAKRLLNPQRPFEQAIINEYLPGQGIAPHIDRDCFGPVVATVSLGSAVNMDFCSDSTGDEYVHRLEPRSLILLHGDARSKWRHGIAKRQSDTVNGQKAKRQRRVSITFRTIAETG